jgi:fibronectin type 3 domain-containing protein
MRGWAFLVLWIVGAATSGAGNLFVDVSGSGTACTQSSPCTLATAVAQMATADTVYVAGGTYTGSGDQVVLLDRDVAVTLQGGWDGAGGGPITVDPTANVTTLDGQNARRVVTITIGSPTIRGFTITGGDATGLAGCQTGSGSPSGCGGGIFAINSIPTIEDNIVEDNVASSLTPAGNGGYGGGIMIDYNWPVIRNNTIRDNVASADAFGQGGGIYCLYCEFGPQIANNEISGNAASGASSGTGGGIYLKGGDVLVTDNLIEGNFAASGATSGSGGGLYANGGKVTVERNVFVGNTGDNIANLSFLDEATFAANRVVANHSPVALYLGYGDSDTPYVASNNFISDGAGANIVLSGNESHPLAANVTYNTIVGDGSNTGLHAYAKTTVLFENNILAGHGLGVQDSGADQLYLDNTLFWNNTDDGIRGDDPLDGDPDFVAPLLRDYHIRVGSSAVDAARESIAAFEDIDGQTRPATANLRDIGADELPPTRFDLGTASSPVATGYTRLSEAEVYSTSSGYGWVAGAVASRNRSGGTALTRDFNFTQAATFGLDLPNGTYDVTMTLGDSAYAHDQMRISLEGNIVDTISTAKGGFVTRTWRTQVVDGKLNVAISDLGGTDANAVVNAIEVRDPTIVKVDFGTSGSPVAHSFAQATNATAYTDETRFGWVSGAVGSRDRGGANPLERDLCFSHSATFRLGPLPSGSYEVVVTAGDASFAHDQISIQVGGASGTGSTAAGEFLQKKYKVGGGGAAGFNLDVQLTDQGGSDANVVINGLQTATLPQIYYDFGTPTSALEEGSLRVSPETTYRPSVGYGWVAGTVGGRDRGSWDSLKRDLDFTHHATFVADLPRGHYYVGVALGDRSFAHDNMRVTVEGVVVGTASTAAGSYTVLERNNVQVNDGQLTIELEDLGGTDPNVAVLYVRVMQ